jgi:uroporphyrinogen III methyltransferase / synthase
VTRPERQAAGMMTGLRAVGAEPVAFPATRIEAPQDGGAALRAAVADLAGFDWVVLSSANGVERLFAALADVGPPGGVEGVRFACVGPGTAAALRMAGFEPELVADRHVAEGLVAGMAALRPAGARVLLPQAAGARPVLVEGLRGLGARVEAVEAYRSVADGRGAGEVRERIDRGEIGVITFTAPSTVERFVEVLGADAGGAVVAVIGPVTAQAAASLGLPPQVVAGQHTVAGLIEALVEHYNNPSTTKS